MAIDTEAIAYHVKGILKALGEDPEREGLKETPERVARMYAEVFAGIAYSNHEIAEMFGKTFSGNRCRTNCSNDERHQRVQLLRTSHGIDV